MAVPSSITDLSTTASSNSPSGSENPKEGDNHLRAAYSFIRTLYNRMTDGLSSITCAAFTANGNVVLGNATTDTLNVGANGIVKNASGDVGIATASPTGRLDVVTGSANRFRLIETSSVLYADSLTAAGSAWMPQVLRATSLTFSVKASGTPVPALEITSAGVVQDAAGNEIGYKGIPRTTSAVANGQCFETTTDVALPAASAGTAFSIYNNSSSAISITAASLTLLRLAATSSTGTRTLASRGMATVWYNGSTTAIISGAGVS